MNPTKSFVEPFRTQQWRFRETVVEGTFCSEIFTKNLVSHPRAGHDVFGVRQKLPDEDKDRAVTSSTVYCHCQNNVIHRIQQEMYILYKFTEMWRASPHPYLFKWQVQKHSTPEMGTFG